MATQQQPASAASAKLAFQRGDVIANVVQIGIDVRARRKLSNAQRSFPNRKKHCPCRRRREVVRIQCQRLAAIVDRFGIARQAEMGDRPRFQASAILPVWPISSVACNSALRCRPEEFSRAIDARAVVAARLTIAEPNVADRALGTNAARRVAVSQRIAQGRVRPVIGHQPGASARQHGEPFRRSPSSRSKRGRRIAGQNSASKLVDVLLDEIPP